MASSIDLTSSQSSQKGADGGEEREHKPAFTKEGVAAGVNPSPNTMATIQNDDDRLLARIGYKQVRTLSTVSLNGIYCRSDI